MLASGIMARTTVNLDDPVLRDLKRLQKKEGKPLGRLMSDLLADAISRKDQETRGVEKPFTWIARPMGLKIDLEDKEAVQEMFDREQFPEFFK
jgi:hypothetical protein